MVYYSLPTLVFIGDTEYKIRNNCDYRVVLDTIDILDDTELSEIYKIACALYRFYDLDRIYSVDENVTKAQKAILCANFLFENKKDNVQPLIDEMMKIINNGEEEKPSNEPKKPPIMNWKHDFKYLVAPINRVLGFDIRTVDFLHWWSFLGAYFEIGECMWANIISIRQKRQKGKKLEKWEQEFYRENRKMVDLPTQLTEDEQEWLYSA